MKVRWWKLILIAGGLFVAYVATYATIRIRSPYKALKWPDGRVGDEGLAFGFPREAWGTPDSDEERIERLGRICQLVFYPCFYADEMLTGVRIGWPGPWSSPR